MSIARHKIARLNSPLRRAFAQDLSFFQLQFCQSMNLSALWILYNSITLSSNILLLNKRSEIRMPEMLFDSFLLKWKVKQMKEIHVVLVPR